MEVGILASCITLAAVGKHAVTLCHNAVKVSKTARKQQKKLETQIRHMKNLQKTIERYGNSALTLKACKQVTKATNALKDFRKATKFLNWDKICGDTTWNQLQAWLKCLRDGVKYALFPSKLNKYLRRVMDHRINLDEIHRQYMLSHTEKDKIQDTNGSQEESPSRVKAEAGSGSGTGKGPIIIGGLIGAAVGVSASAILVGGAVAVAVGTGVGAAVGGLLGWYFR